MQLVAYGAQDIYLTGNPQITFFKVVYRRHTNFSMESIEQTFNGSVGFGNKVTSTISRNGDLVSRLYVEMDPSAIFDQANYAPNPTHNLLKEMELEIGGQRIDKHYSHWLNVWTELTEDTHVCIAGDSGKLFVADTSSGATGEVHRAPSAYQLMSCAVKCDGADAIAEKHATVPLQFWFCRNPGLALPLIALQYHEVKVSITFETAARLSATACTGNLNSVKLWADYIYLDTDERRRFAQVSHEYLIEQLQYQNESVGSSFNLNFNHPVKELIWAGARGATASINGGVSNPTELSLTSDGTTKLSESTASAGATCTIKLNGHERFSPRHNNYFTRTQPWQHHSSPGGGVKGDAISVYSFALKPEEHQPSGTCNFSRIDNAQLVFTKSVCGASTSDGLHIYAVNYNVLRIMSGMGGLAYSN
jgi:hypothetical protein